MSGRPQMDSKGASVMLAFMGGVSVGLVDKTWVCAPVAIVLVCMAVWQYRLEDRP